MFLDYYRFHEQPFGVSPDPKYIYFSPTHREALASLAYSIESGCGFTAMIARPGMGKTTLLFRLLDHLKTKARTGFLFQTQCHSGDLLRYILADMGVKGSGNDPVEMHAQLNEVLLREARVGRHTVVAIDEAHNLDVGTLETVRQLSNFETPRQKLLQIILSGQPGLADKLARPEMAQLRQRITVLSRLAPLSPQETVRYIEHRLGVAGYKGKTLFTTEAMNLIARESQGVPRVINTMCFHALSIGCALGRDQIDSDIILEALSDLSVDFLIEEIKAAPAVWTPVVPVAAYGASLAPSGTESTYDAPLAQAPPANQTITRQPVPPERVPASAPRVEAVKSSPASKVAMAHQVSVSFARLTRYGRWFAGMGVVGVLLLWIAMRADFSFVRTQTALRGTSRAASPVGTPLYAAEPLVHVISPNETLVDSRPGATTPVEARIYPDALRIHVVQPNETLGGISVQYVGHYDLRVLAEVQKLNADVKDPDRIVPGQQILLPPPATDSQAGISPGTK